MIEYLDIVRIGAVLFTLAVAVWFVASWLANFTAWYEDRHERKRKP